MIACRITAECPETGFKPGGGQLHQLRPPGWPGVWAYFSIGSGGAVHEWADSQFGHVFARGASREEARLKMLGALKDLRIESDFRHTVGYLQGLLAEEPFCQGKISTAWLDGLIRQKFQPPMAISLNAIIIAGAVVMGLGRWDQQWAEALSLLQRRQYPPRSLLELQHRHSFLHAGYLHVVQTAMAGKDRIIITCKDTSCAVTFRRQMDGALLLETNCSSWLVTHQREADGGVRLCINGQQVMLGTPQDPSRLRAPSSGKLIRYLVEEGERVEAGQSIAELEVMKMCLTIASQAAGIIRLQKPVGSVIANGDLLARLELFETPKAKAQESDFRFEPEEERGPLKPHQVLLGLEGRLEAMLQGWMETNYERIIPNYLVALRVKTVPFYLLAEQVQADHHPQRSAILNLVQRAKREGPSGDLIREVQSLVPEWRYGRDFEYGQIVKLVEQFIAVEQCFGHSSIDGVLEVIRQKYPDHEQQMMVILAHDRLEARSSLLLKLLERLLHTRPEASGHQVIQQSLKRLGQLPAGKMARRAREMLLASQLPSLAEQRRQMMERLKTALNLDSPSLREAYLAELIQGHTTHLDALPQLLHHHGDRDLARLALEIYIRRLFEPYYQFRLLPLMEDDQDNICCCWSFKDSHTVDQAGWVTLENNTGALSPMPEGGERAGLITVIESLSHFKSSLGNLVEGLGSLGGSFHRNVLYLVAPHPEDLSDAEIIEQVSQQLASTALDAAQVRRVTLMTVRAHLPAPGFYTFRGNCGWKEDCTVRHIEPALAHLLAFPRMIANHDISFCYADPTGQIHIYRGLAKEKGKEPDAKFLGSRARLLVRLLIRPNTALKHLLPSLAHWQAEAASILEEIFEVLETLDHPAGETPICNDIFINILPPFLNTPAEFAAMVTRLMETYRRQFQKVQINSGDIVISLTPARGIPAQRYRFLLSNPTGLVIHVHGYLEGEGKRLKGLQPGLPMEGQSTHFPLPPVQPVQAKRVRVQALGSAYIYDFPAIFEHALGQQWRTLGSEVPPALLHAEELDFDENGQLCVVTRQMGENKCGMVAWRVRIKSPEAAEGRDFILIGNDLTFEIGSFGPAEDRLFQAASAMARQLGIPRLYLSANSGARLGLAEEVRNAFKVAWKDDKDPTKGFDYLYLDEADYARLSASVQATKLISASGEVHYKLDCVIGREDGLGVECLSGSGLIAGETSRAYEEIFTLTLVCGRTVGIGAYLVRLGQRCIQRAEHPIILTGVGALNQLLGREVYADNLQIGGPQIMMANGVSHRVVEDDLTGVTEMLRWLSMVPLRTGELPPVLASKDPVDRAVDYNPDSDAYDPRWLIEGKLTEDGSWLSGILDRGSWWEVMAGWARTVVCGRGRLGGIPVGVLAVETRPVDRLIPADPADPHGSQPQVQRQAGQVWYPDSAHKTAQFIRDCGVGESLPLLILANWRGFSGGQRDLLDEVLKFGAQIVDALRRHPSPIMIYLPPKAELRGGSWVVLDTAINPQQIEMYADPSARANILEPEGMVAIKFRASHQQACMRRLGHEPSEAMASVYQQVAGHFAELHDRPGRMEAKGVIKAIVPWSESRRYFHRRLYEKMYQN